MKLASYDDGSRDGHLVVVSRDLGTAHYASGIATRMQQVLDDWTFLAPQLQELSVSLDHGRARHAFPFEPQRCRAPLPRAHRWVGARAWRDPAPQEAALPPGPTWHAGAGDALLGAHAAIEPPADAALDCEAQWVALCSSVARGSRPAQALEHVRLLGLAGAWWLRAQTPGEADAWLASSFSPVFVTPDELGEHWRGGQLHQALKLRINGKSLGACDAGSGMHWHAGQVLTWLARHQPLGSGTLLGLGPVRAQAAEGDTRPGWACLSDARQAGSRRAWLAPGDTVDITLDGRDSGDVFGAVQASVRAWEPETFGEAA